MVMVHGPLVVYVASLDLFSRHNHAGPVVLLFSWRQVMYSPIGVCPQYSVRWQTSEGHHQVFPCDTTLVSGGLAVSGLPSASRGVNQSPANGGQTYHTWSLNRHLV